jgi:HPt (histidine-containing phosphotransfer) domain-containing protein
MKKKLSHLPIIDKNQYKQFNKNADKILSELLNLFIEETPKLQTEINLAYQNKDKEKLEDLLHKLYGSCIYCGLTRLKTCIDTLKNETVNLNYSKDVLKQFNQEIIASLDKAKEITHS